MEIPEDRYNQLVALARRVSHLNPEIPEIGAGMLASLVEDAKRALEDVPISFPKALDIFNIPGRGNCYVVELERDRKDFSDIIGHRVRVGDHVIAVAGVETHPIALRSGKKVSLLEARPSWMTDEISSMIQYARSKGWLVWHYPAGLSPYPGSTVVLAPHYAFMGRLDRFPTMREGVGGDDEPIRDLDRLRKICKTPLSLPQIHCPECGELIWDVGYGHKLNKCWNTEGHPDGGTLAFDSPEEEDDDD